MPVTSSAFRAAARKALQNHWQTALLIALIVNLPTLLVQAITSFTGNDPFARLEAAVISLSRDGTLSEAALQSAAEQILHTPGIWIMAGFSVLAWLITPCLTLGMNHWILDRLRGKEGAVTVVFSRARFFLKAIGLRLFTSLLVLLWMLPGMAVTFGLTALLSAQDAVLSDRTFSFIMLIGTFAMLVPGIMAALRYALAVYFMADLPEKGIRTCVRESVSRMKGHVGMLFSLYLSFILWYLLEMLIASLTLSFFGAVASLMIQMLCSLALGVYLETAVGAFHEYITGLS